MITTKFLSLLLLSIATLPSSRAQIAPSETQKATPDSVPQAMIEFRPVSKGIPISPEDAFIGYPFCSADGTLFLESVLHPDFTQQALIGISPQGELSRYRVGAANGLTNITVLSFDAIGSEVYALVSAQKIEELRNHDLDPGDPGTKGRSQYYQYHILHFRPDLSAPDEVTPDIPLPVSRLAVFDRDTILILGFARANQVPVIDTIDRKGQLVREIDLHDSLGDTKTILANATQQLKNQWNEQSIPEAVQLEAVLSAAQLIHYGDSLLLLIPGAHPGVITLQRDGEVQSTKLNLPQGQEARSLISSDSRWFVRLSDGGPDQHGMVAVIDPATGDILRIIRTAPLSANDVACVHEGRYLAIHWAGEGNSLKPIANGGDAVDLRPLIRAANLGGLPSGLWMPIGVAVNTSCEPAPIPPAAGSRRKSSRG